MTLIQSSSECVPSDPLFQTPSSSLTPFLVNFEIRIESARVDERNRKINRKWMSVDYYSCTTVYQVLDRLHSNDNVTKV